MDQEGCFKRDIGGMLVRPRQSTVGMIAVMTPTHSFPCSADTTVPLMYEVAQV